MNKKPGTQPTLAAAARRHEPSKSKDMVHQRRSHGSLRKQMHEQLRGRRHPQRRQGIAHQQTRREIHPAWHPAAQRSRRRIGQSRCVPRRILAPCAGRQQGAETVLRAHQEHLVHAIDDGVHHSKRAGPAAIGRDADKERIDGQGTSGMGQPDHRKDGRDSKACEESGNAEDKTQRFKRHREPQHRDASQEAEVQKGGLAVSGRHAVNACFKLLTLATALPF
mmetsp:Transcript_5576/g.15135  ORF Transcript_5576/g.15135 Transcript_5576/m.15135 type:complete len:222 (-) Transcript_5576:96-761(-)